MKDRTKVGRSTAADLTSDDVTGHYHDPQEEGKKKARNDVNAGPMETVLSPKKTGETRNREISVRPTLSVLIKQTDYRLAPNWSDYNAGC